MVKKKVANDCNNNHWVIIDGQLFLTTLDEEQQEIVKTVIKVLEKQIRIKISEDIWNWKPLTGRKDIMKLSGSLDNALIGVQAICADIALGESNGRL